VVVKPRFTPVMASAKVASIPGPIAVGPLKLGLSKETRVNWSLVTVSPI